MSHQKARDHLLKATPQSEGDALALDELAKDSDVGKTVLNEVARELMEEGLLLWVGAGKKNDKYRYYRPGIHSNAHGDGVAEERNVPVAQANNEIHSPASSSLRAEERILLDQGEDVFEWTG